MLTDQQPVVQPGNLPVPSSRRRPDRHALRLLVVLASYGTRNLALLKRLIEMYQHMTASVQIVVLSEGPKQLPANVRVVQGLPSPNPWSLPFAHKPLFAESVDDYDLFIYSEDDMEFTRSHLDAFLDATEVLHEDEIAGFLRFEKDTAGAVWMPDLHGMYRWKPESVVRRGGLTFAEHTNEHAALYILTSRQLKAAIASGGFMREPYEGRHDMLCAAATDPYTSCGFRKVVCLSRLDRFLIHHMSNRYAAATGLPLADVQSQVRTLEAIQAGAHPTTTLCATESRCVRGAWSKSFYEPPNPALLARVGAGVTTLLSVGCGWGAAEEELVRRGIAVTALPLDSVIGAEAAKRGVEVVDGRLEDCDATLAGRLYDCVVITNLLHLQRDPAAFLTRVLKFVGPGGSLIVDSPNFARLATQAKQRFGRNREGDLSDFSQSGVTQVAPKDVRACVGPAGFSRTDVHWYGHALPKATGIAHLPIRLGRLTAAGWIFVATRA